MAILRRRGLEMHMRWFDRRWQDIRYSFRMLRRSPVFTLVAVSVLALGIGVNAAVYSVISAIFFRPLGVKAPEQLMFVYQEDQGYREFWTYYFDVLYLRQHTEVFSAVAGRTPRPERFRVDHETETVNGETVTANYFDVLGITPELGRLLAASDGDPASPERAVVISDSYWTSRFNRSLAVLGAHVRLNDVDFTIVGVASPGFDGTAEAWLPSRFWITTEQFMDRNFGEARTVAMLPIGRLRPGVTPAAAEAMVRAQAPELRRKWLDSLGLIHAATNPYLAVQVLDTPLPSTPIGESVPRKLALAVTIVVMLVLLIAASNIAGILMARGIARTGELAVRQALGGSPGRLMGQLLTESMMIASIGGVGSLSIAWALTRIYGALTPLMYVVHASLDWQVVAFAAAVCAVSGIVFGIAPARQARRINVLGALGGGSGTTRRTGRRLRHGIVIPQLGVAWLLLVLAGVHARALWHIETRDLGYATDHRLVLNVLANRPDQGVPSNPEARKADAARRVGLYREVIARAASVPDVINAGATATLPTSGGLSSFPFISDQLYRSGSRTSVPAQTYYVSTHLLATMGIALLEGRDFDDSRDVSDAPRVAIVSKALATRLWPGTDPLQRGIASWRANDQKEPVWQMVIGVADDIDPIVTPRGSAPAVYLAAAQSIGGLNSLGGTNLIVQTNDDPARAAASVKRVVADADPTIEISNVQTMGQVVSQILYPRRAAAGILSASGIAGLLLAAVGLYGVISYSVAQRLREIGVRATLGATRADIMRMVMREGAVVTAIGGGIGFGLSLFALRLTSSLVGTVPTTDAAIFMAVPIVMMLVIGAASFVPARRAARVDPIEVLRAL